MDGFIEYIRNTALVKYTDWHPHNEVIAGMYLVIAGSVRERAGSLTVTREHVLTQRGDVELGRIDIGWHERKCRRIKPGQKSLRYTCFRDALALIIQHDAEVRKHLELVEETPERLTYRFVFDNQEE